MLNDIDNNRSCCCSSCNMNSCNTGNNCMCNNMDNQSCECRRATREEMLREIRSLKFAINELALYLDTHPCDEKAICLHKEYCKKYRDLTDKYQKIYGPLTIEFPCNKWRWLEEPWPWERGNF